MQRRFERFLETGGLVTVGSSSLWRLVGKIEICMIEKILVLMRSLGGSNRMVLVNRWLRCPIHSSGKSL